MDKQEKVNLEIEKTLASLDRIDRATPDDFFYTRLKGRMEEYRESVQWSFPLIWRVALTILLLVNGFTVYTLTQEDEEAEDPLTTLAADYFDMQDDTYEINVMQE